MRSIAKSLGYLAFCVFLLVRCAAAEELTNNFDSWPGTPLTGGIYTNNGWVVNNGRVQSSFGYHSPSNAAWLLNYLSGSTPTFTNSYVSTPPLTNGIGLFEFFTTNRLTNSLEFQVQTSTNNGST